LNSPRKNFIASRKFFPTHFLLSAVLKPGRQPRQITRTVQTTHHLKQISARLKPQHKQYRRAFSTFRTPVAGGPVNFSGNKYAKPPE
jgi:hypothetical protein